MQVFQPLELALGIFIGLIGSLSLLLGLYRLKSTLPSIRGRNAWMMLLNGPLLIAVALRWISYGFDPSGHPTSRTLILDSVGVIAAAVIVALFITMARADWKAQKQRLSKPLA